MKKQTENNLKNKSIKLVEGVVGTSLTITGTFLFGSAIRYDTLAKTSPDHFISNYMLGSIFDISGLIGVGSGIYCFRNLFKKEDISSKANKIRTLEEYKKMLLETKKSNENKNQRTRSD